MFVQDMMKAAAVVIIGWILMSLLYAKFVQKERSRRNGVLREARRLFRRLSSEGVSMVGFDEPLADVDDFVSRHPWLSNFGLTKERARELRLSAIRRQITNYPGAHFI